jgi:hypothetical protein
MKILLRRDWMTFDRGELKLIRVGHAHWAVVSRDRARIGGHLSQRDPIWEALAVPDVEWLANRGLIFNPFDLKSISFVTPSDAPPDQQILEELARDQVRRAKTLIDANAFWDSPDEAKRKSIRELFREVCDLASRQVAFDLSKGLNVDAVSLVLDWRNHGEYSPSLAFGSYALIGGH